MEKATGRLNYLYRLDQNVIDLIKELENIEFQSGQKNNNYQRLTGILKFLLEEEFSCLDEFCTDTGMLNAILIIHSQLINNNPNFMILALTEDLDKLMFNHIYNIVIKWISMRNFESSSSSEEIIKTMLRIELYIDYLQRCQNPELKYKLAYLYPPLGEKLIFDGFNLNKSQISDENMVYLCELEDYENIREQFFINEFVQTLGFMLVSKKGIKNFEQLFQYLEIIASKMDNDQLNKAYQLVLEKSPNHSCFIKEILKILKNKEKNLTN